MNTQGIRQAEAAHRGLGWRVLDMTLLWAGFGLVIGPGGAAPGGNWIGLVAAVVAALIIMPPLGALLGLVGGRWRESLVGGLMGFALGSLAGWMQETQTPALLANVGLIFGGLVGGTFLGLFYRLPCWLVGQAGRASINP